MSNVKIVYEDLSPGAKKLVEYTTEEENKYSNIEQLKNDSNEVPRYVTLEPLLVALDDNNKLHDDTDEIFGYMSNSMSDNDGTFETPIVITRTFSQNISSTGVTFTFSNYFNNYCNNLKIQWYQDDTLLDEKEYTPNNYIYFCSNNVSYFNKEVITFYSTNNPYRYLKIAGLDDGVIRTFEEDEITNIKILEELDPISEELSINTMNLDINSSSDVDFMFQKKQAMKVYYKEDIIGAYYITESSQKSSSKYSIKLEDYVGALDNSYFMGGLYTSNTVESIVNAIISDEAITIDIQDDLKSITLSGYIPICTKREALQLVAFSCNAVVDTSRTNSIKVFTLKEDDEVINITDENTFNDMTYITDEPITTVKLKAHSYTKKSETDEVYNDTLNGTVTVEFSEPYTNYSISGGTLVASDYNYITITGTGSNVTVTAYGYDHNETIYSVTNPAIDSSMLSNEVSYDDVTLVTSSNVESVLNHIAEHLFKRESIEVKLALANNEGTGDLLAINTDFKGTKTARVTSCELSLSGKLIGTIKGVINE